MPQFLGENISEEMSWETKIAKIWEKRTEKQLTPHQHSNQSAG